ncbi:MAG: phosphatase PAP2 family protein [Promethearchaeota archaeon]
MTLIFYFTPLDLLIAGAFYNPSGPVRFPLGDEYPWKFFNEKDYVFLIIMLLFAIFLLILGLSRRRFRPFLVYCLFSFLSAIIGPLLVVNVFFKGAEFGDFYIGWARPRPREILDFGGTERFYRVWEPAFLDGLRSTNSSFPSGHVTEGAMFIVIFFVFNNIGFLMEVFGGKSKRKALILNIVKWSGLASSIFIGFMLAISRIAAGAHFASDTLYSFVFTWGPTAILYYFVFNIPKLERKTLEKMSAIKKES